MTLVRLLAKGMVSLTTKIFLGDGPVQEPSCLIGDTYGMVLLLVTSLSFPSEPL